MVNLQGYTKVMVNRCIELLNQKIASAQTRHIAKRATGLSPLMKTLSREYRVRELKKTQEYMAKKRRSIWELNEAKKSKAETQVRLDESNYKHIDIKARAYKRTWTNFPKRPLLRRKPNIKPMEPESNPMRRRLADERPVTAKPYNEHAINFINQWNNNMAMINRNRFARTVDHCPAPVMLPTVNGLFYY